RVPPTPHLFAYTTLFRPELLLDEPGLAACYSAAAQGLSVSAERAGKPQLRLVFGTGTAPERAELEPDEPVADHRGINVHAKQSVDRKSTRLNSSHVKISY